MGVSLEPSLRPMTAARAGSTGWRSGPNSAGKAWAPGSSSKRSNISPGWDWHLAGMGLDVFSCLIEEGSEASMSLFGKLGYKYRPDIRYFVKKSTSGS